MAQRVRAGVAEARGQTQVAQAPKSPNAAGGARVSGTVRVDPKLAARIGPDDTVFIFARAAEGPRMPLAVLRKQGRDLPVRFTLDDSMAMAPQMKLSAFPRVVIGARVSKSANATVQPGDLQGASAPIAVGSERVEVTIDTEVR
jgi:cytochrome c-type biogenesis protein CcmH